MLGTSAQSRISQERNPRVSKSNGINDDEKTTKNRRGGSTRVPKRGEVAKGLEPRQEAILAALCNNEPRQALQTPANGTLGYIKRPIASARSRERVFLLAASEETGPFIHSDWTNSNGRPKWAPTKANIKPRSIPSSSRTPFGSGGPYEVRRRIIRWMRTTPATSASRGFIRRMWEPHGVL